MRCLRSLRAAAPQLQQQHQPCQQLTHLSLPVAVYSLHGSQRLFSISSKAQPRKLQRPSIAQRRLKQAKYRPRQPVAEPSRSSALYCSRHNVYADEEVHDLTADQLESYDSNEAVLQPSHNTSNHHTTPPSVSGPWRPFDTVEWPVVTADTVEQRSVSVVILGTPNAGKSLLMNALLHNHLTAVSPKRNTTRTTIKGIYTSHDLQMVVYDTPGINANTNAKQYQRELSTSAWSALPHADVAILLIDAAKPLQAAEHELIRKVSDYYTSSPDMKLLVCLNKVDLVSPKDLLLDRAQEIADLLPSYSEIYMISALDQDGIGDIASFLYNNSIQRAWLYERDQTTDSSKLQVMHEIIREKIYQRIHQELPYSIEQSTSSVDVLQNDALQIHHNIIVQQPAHVPMVIGSNGGVVRWIIQQATPAIEELYDRKVYLSLRVLRSSKANKPDIQSEAVLTMAEYMHT